MSTTARRLPALARSACGVCKHSLKQSSRTAAAVPMAFAAGPQAFSSSSRSAAASRRSDRNLESSDRVYTARKTFLFKTYNHLLDNSDIVLVFQHNGLSSAETDLITKAIASVPLPADLNTDGSTDDELNAKRARLMIARTGVMSAVSRARDPSTTLSSLLSGPVALLTCPTLSPKYLGNVLAAINKALGYRSPPAASINASSPMPVSPRLMLLGGILEKRVLLSAQEIVEASRIPEKSHLLAELVGVLEAPGSQLAALLGQAGGGGLLRTLQGLEAGLKEKEAN